MFARIHPTNPNRVEIGHFVGKQFQPIAVPSMEEFNHTMGDSAVKALRAKRNGGFSRFYIRPVERPTCRSTS